MSRLRCEHCGRMKDSPQHELGCPIERGRQEGERGDLKQRLRQTKAELEELRGSEADQAEKHRYWHERYDKAAAENVELKKRIADLLFQYPGAEAWLRSRARGRSDPLDEEE